MESKYREVVIKNERLSELMDSKDSIFEAQQALVEEMKIIDTKLGEKGKEMQALKDEMLPIVEEHKGEVDEIFEVVTELTKNDDGDTVIKIYDRVAEYKAGLQKQYDEAIKLADDAEEQHQKDLLEATEAPTSEEEVK